MSILWMIGGFLIVLAPIVLVHELGHFIAARLSNIRVEEFGLGLPPRAMTLAKKNGTIYSLNWIPLGGFVRPAGEDDPSIADGLAAASKRARLFVLSAGAGANFLLALVVFWIALMLGTPIMEVAVDYVRPDTPAAAAGLQEGDVIRAVNGIEAGNDGRNISLAMNENAGEPVEMLIRRDGALMTTTVVPREPGEYDPEVEGPIGIGLAYKEIGRLTLGPGEAITGAVDSIWEYISLFVRVPAMLINGELSPSEARPVSIVGISQIAGRAAEVSVVSQDVVPLLNMMAFISLALGLTNLLPLPALDGGRIMFVLIEAVRGQRIEPEREGMVHIIGMLFLLGLMVLMIVQDIVNPIIPF